MGLAAKKPAWNSFPRNVSHGNSPHKISMGFCPHESPMELSSMVRAVHHGKSMAFVPPIFHRFPMGFCPYETPMDFRCNAYMMEFLCWFHRGKNLWELYGIYFIKNSMDDFRTGFTVFTHFSLWDNKIILLIIY